MEMLAVPAGRPQPHVQLIREDLVQRLSDPQQIGLVSRVAGDSSDSNISNSGDDDGETDRYVEEGCAQIVWLNSKESTEKVTDVRVIDRAFLHGDIVATVSDPLGQTGTVVDIELSVNVELPNSEIVESIDSRRLRRVRTLMPGDYVTQGNWLGRVEEVMDNVTVVFEDGAKCKIFRADTDRLIPIIDSLTDDANSPYYPGQQVRGAAPCIFKLAKWLRGRWKPNRTVQGMVVGVEPGSVFVNWIASGNASSGTQSSAVPMMLQKPFNLLPMLHFTYTYWQLGDRAFLPLGFDANDLISGAEAANDPTFEREHAGHESPVDFGNAPKPETILDHDAIVDSLHVHKQKTSKKQRKAAKRERKTLVRRERGAEYAGLIVTTKTSMDVLWQDGTRSCRLNASSLVPVEYLGDHEFWPEQYVLAGEGLDNEEGHVGIVKSVDAKERTAIVHWLRHNNESHNYRGSPEFDGQENVSVYELVEHPHYKYCLGDVVVRLLSQEPSKAQFEVDNLHSAQEQADHLDHNLQIATSTPFEEGDVGSPPKMSRGFWRRGQKGRRANRYKCPLIDLSWVGNVIGLKDGDIEVVWANGTISKVGPHDIFVVSREEDEVTTLVEANELEISCVDDNASWETVDYDENEDSISPLEQGRQVSTTLRPSLENYDQDHNDYNELETFSSNIMDSLKEMELEPSFRKIEQTLHNPRHYRCPITARMMRLLSRLVVAFRPNGYRNCNNLEFKTVTGLCCSKHGGEEVLETHEPFPMDRVSANASDSKRTSENTTSDFGNKEIYYTCISESELAGSDPSTRHIKRDFGNKEMYYTCISGSEAGSDPSTRHIKGKPTIKHLDDGEDSTEVYVSKQLTDEGTQGRVLKSIHFKQFDSVMDPSDHHFANVAQLNILHDRKWLKQVRHEWNILEKSLPETIYVRVYENRMDLLRAAIVGAKGTPYHDGLFMFDIHLPPDFPHTPPVAYYHSGGLKLNPNLYESGKVCLSLLNTWIGKGVELWDPSKSSILQILVSIQGLVLNTKPYFNEDGYERQVGTAEGQKNSVVYNENVFLLSCKSMLYLLRRPPMINGFEDQRLTIQKISQLGSHTLEYSCWSGHDLDTLLLLSDGKIWLAHMIHFETLIRQHFAQQGVGLLQACEAYLNGALVGLLEDDMKPRNEAFSTEGEESSAGFRLMLAKLVVKLAKAFSDL